VSLSTPFIRRPVATTLLTFGVAAAGAVAVFQLPVAPLPQVDIPTISVQAQLPGASPEVVATTVATPLERHLGQIADVTEMTSSSSVGSARITLQFGLDRDIDGAARDVQAAINAARADLPASLRSNPTYRKVNPADAPILIIALTSDTLSRGALYDVATNVLAQKLSQVEGVGEVTLGGSSLPAVRVELNPYVLNQYGIGLEDVRAALAAANARSPKGTIDVSGQSYQLYANDQASKADDYRQLIVAYRNGAAVRVGDVGEVLDSVENIRNAGIANDKPAVLVIVSRQPAANIIGTVDRVLALLPELKADISPAIDLTVANDRSTTIRASLADVERTLLIAVAFVILVVYVFLRSARSILIPAVAVPVSLIGTFAAMYMLGYSLDNLSLMALTVATGFVVDDAVVVLENIARHVEAGVPRVEAALRGAGEVAFTVLSMSVSLIAVFIPILLMGGIIGRLFREFAVTLSVAILISLAVSLATTPMMCAVLLRPPRATGQGWLSRMSERLFNGIVHSYRDSLAWALRHPLPVMLALFVVIGLNFYLYVAIPKGFFPQQETGRLVGGVQADQSISFQLMEKKFAEFVAIIRKDPAVESVVGFTGGQGNFGLVFIALKPLAERKLSADLVIARLRKQLIVPGATLFVQPVQDIRVGGRQSNALYQYTLQSDDLQELNDWSPRIAAELQKIPELTDVNSDQQNKGLQTDLVIDRDTAARLGVTVSQIDNTLYDAFGQRQVSTIYNARNQYHVIMELAPPYWQDPDALKAVYVSSSGGAIGGTQATNAIAGTFTTGTAKSSASTVAANAVRNLATNSIAAVGHGSASSGAAVSTAAATAIPLAVLAHYQLDRTPLAVNHQGMFVATTISFNLAPGVSLSQVSPLIDDAMNRLGVPATVRGSFQGTARTSQDSFASEPLLILAAILAVYIVLGVLYESYVHPLTILSTLPSAGVGALLALLLMQTEFSIIAFIGVILLIGIVKKNAIMMIDFALVAERERGLSPHDAIFEACLLRLRPILMTTAAALLGGLPLAIGLGEGSELRQPLGIAIVGGLMLSQLLTLYTTPVVYLYLDRLRRWGRGLSTGMLREVPRGRALPAE
jgi:multidrug efflux pump